MALCFPSMCIGVNRQEWFTSSPRASAWVRFSATIDFLEASRSTHLTVGTLLLNSVNRFSSKFLHTPSMTSHSSKRLAISRSEFEMFPLQLVGETMFNLISFGHSHQKTVGRHDEPLPNTTPLTPCPEASTIPMKLGHPQISSLHRVGSAINSRKRV